MRGEVGDPAAAGGLWGGGEVGGLRAAGWRRRVEGWGVGEGGG